MVVIDMRDPHLSENVKAIKELQAVGYSDEEIQGLYDTQRKMDKEAEDEP